MHDYRSSEADHGSSGAASPGTTVAAADQELSALALCSVRFCSRPESGDPSCNYINLRVPENRGLPRIFAPDAAAAAAFEGRRGFGGRLAMGRSGEQRCAQASNRQIVEALRPDIIRQGQDLD